MTNKFDPNYLCFMDLKACIYAGLRVDYEKRI